jgi:FAD/FMN-containing dehydrogenase
MKLLLYVLGAAQFAVSTPLQTAPEGCRKLPSDSDWPSLETWKAALPGVQPKEASCGTCPDYRFVVKSISDVQKAVKFAVQNNIRVSVIASGHDFLGRNTAGSGLWIDTSKMNKVKILESFTPTTKGAEPPEGPVNTIVPKPNIQAAVTFGAGINTQELNDLISPSKLFTMGAGHG